MLRVLIALIGALGIGSLVWIGVAADFRELYTADGWLPAVMLVLPAVFLTQAWRDRRRR